MGTQTASTPSFARFTRAGFGFTPRTESKNKSRNANGDDEWYIPYNGPYEPPPKESPPRRQRARDSWGDPVDGLENEEENMGLDRELHLRYGGHRGRGGPEFRGSGEGEEYDKRRGRSRDRTFSVISGGTTSSGAVDPSRASMMTTTTAPRRRRSTISSGSPPPVPPSFINLDALRAGGVGESPVPPHATRRRRHSKELDANRISIASIFSFGAGGGSARKSAQVSSSAQKAALARLNTKSYGKQDSPAHSGSSSSDHQPHSEPNKHHQLHDQITMQADRLSSTVTDDEDYYNSYYSTLLNPRNPNKTDTRLSPTTPTSGSSISHGAAVSRQNSTSTSSGHPYAYVFPQKLTPIPSANDIPHSAPLIPTPYTSNNAPKLTFTTPQVHGPSSADPGHTAFSPRLGVSNVGKLKASISTPNLRDTAIVSDHNMTSTAANYNINNNPQPIPNFMFPKGKDRWLSAETWCDALLFPRPRLKLKQPPPVEGGPHIIQRTESASGRIVSPPTTPLKEEEFGVMQRGGWPPREVGVESRVLAHSRSLVDLNSKQPQKVRKEKGLVASSKDVIAAGEAAKAVGKAPRPTSWAQDDLALLSPAPSLAHVLREGERLDLDRRAWQTQAMNSLGNKQARSLSRTRSKSLTQKGRRKMELGDSGGSGRGKGHHHQSSMEYIAARACLGSQGVSMTPTIPPPKLGTSFSDGNTSSGTHSHSNSLAKTFSKSSKSHSRGHSRNDSWSKSAIKLAKATVICGFPSGDAANVLSDTRSSIIGTGPHHGAAPDLEGALKRDGTKVIRLADPALLPIDRGTLPPLTSGASTASLGHANYTYARKTPSPSGSNSISESKVGVAIGTPPEEENANNTDADYENYVPSHPYAQGGLSFSTGSGGGGEAHQQSQSKQHGEFAGAHLSLAHPANSVKVPPISEILARHKLPPHMTALHMPHPYAQARAQSGAPRDSYIDANGLVGQHRSEGTTPHTAKMWAQLSPGVVREILPEDLQYSPYLGGGGAGQSGGGGGGEGKEKEVEDDDNDDDGGDVKDRRTLNIRDTVGLGETLVRAGEAGDNLLPEFKSRRRDGVHLVSSRSVDLGKKHLQQSLDEPDPSQVVEYIPEAGPTQENSARHPSTSTTFNTTSSPHTSNDLDTFKDLFFRPSNSHSLQRTPREPALPESPSPPHHITNSAGSSANVSWDLHRRTGSSSLTNLARQLNDEFEQMALERGLERTSSQYSSGNGTFPSEDQRASSSGISSRQVSRGSSLSGGNGVGVGGLVRRPTGDGRSLEFVFEEVTPMSSSPTSEHGGLGMGMADPIHAFEPSDTLPEDVQSSRASSFIESSEGDDPTAMFRVGIVESVSTPPAVSSMHRTSFLGTVFAHDSNPNVPIPAHANESPSQNSNQDLNEQEGQERRPRPRHEEVVSPESHAARIISGLHPASTEATRSSYMTTSTASRMSGLSDFPAPPRSHHHPYHHMGNVENVEDDTVVINPLQQQQQQGSHHLAATPGHMSLLSSYFNEAMAQSESQAVSLADGLHQDSPALTLAALEEEEQVSSSTTHQEHAR